MINCNPRREISVSIEVRSDSAKKKHQRGTLGSQRHCIGPKIDMNFDPVFQSKAFSGAMGPSNIQPYYYKASDTTEGEDISISTIVTSDRFPVLSRLASRYQGM